MPQERPAATTLKGNPFTLVGPELKAGDKAPAFTAVGNDLKEVTSGRHRPERCGSSASCLRSTRRCATPRLAGSIRRLPTWEM